MNWGTKLPLTKEEQAIVSAHVSFVPLPTGDCLEILSPKGWLKLIASYPQFQGIDEAPIKRAEGCLTGYRTTIRHPQGGVTVTKYLKDYNNPVSLAHPEQFIKNAALVAAASEFYKMFQGTKPEPVVLSEERQAALRLRMDELLKNKARSHANIAEAKEQALKELEPAIYKTNYGTE
jgi:hypothetical protein